MGAGERGCSRGTLAHPMSPPRKPRGSEDILCSGVQHPALSLQLGVLRMLLGTPILGQGCRVAVPP